MGRVLWIGSYITEAMIENINNLGYKNAASYLSQKNILEGLEYHTGKKFDSIGAVVFPDYPKCGVLGFRRRVMKRSSDSENILAGFINLKYFNKISTSHSLVKEAKRWAVKYKNENSPDIFIYEMRSACLNAASVIKKIIPSARIHLIIPDLPLFMDLKMGRIKRVLKRYDFSIMQKNMKIVDTYIVYAEPMVEYLGISDKKWILMEGSINVEECKNDIVMRPQLERSDKCIVMYSGYLDSRFGFMKLIDAFRKLNNRYELWITGDGPMKEKIREIALETANIRYYGFLNSRYELLCLQQQATLMINMRDPEEEASKYCFPSKIFEYMLTGKPVLSCRLAGIPEEYFDYLVELNSLEPDDIVAAIKDIFEISKNDRLKRGLAGKNFVLTMKNNLIQTEKILKFINIGNSEDIYD